MSTRKEKVTKAQERRKQPAVKAEMVRDAVPAFHPQMVRDNTPIPAVKAEGVKEAVPTPATHSAMVRDYEPLPEVQNPLEQKEAGINVPTIDERIQKSLDERASAQQGEQQPQTLSDMLAPRLEELKEKAETEKTDAQKMQRYYALTDALKSLGKMGGAAIGGAIGGDMLGGAPTVGEYKESRGYLDAFEKARQANDRLRALDDKEFQLAEKDADRSYQQQVAKAEREYKAEQAQIEREWNREFYDYKAKMEQALSAGNMALAQQYKLELLEAENKAKAAYQSVQNAFDEKMKNISLQIAHIQNNPNKKSTPVRFSDGSSAVIPDWLFEGLKENLVGSIVDGKRVKKDDVMQVIKDNPDLAYEFLGGFGIERPAPVINDNWAASVIDKASFPQHITQVPESEMAVRPQQGAVPVKKDFSANKRKK